MTYDIIHSKTEDPIDQTIGSCFRMADHHCLIHSDHCFSFLNSIPGLIFSHLCVAGIQIPSLLIRLVCHSLKRYFNSKFSSEENHVQAAIKLNRKNRHRGMSGI